MRLDCARSADCQFAFTQANIQSQLEHLDCISEACCMIRSSDFPCDRRCQARHRKKLPPPQEFEGCVQIVYARLCGSQPQRLLRRAQARPCPGCKGIWLCAPSQSGAESQAHSQEKGNRHQGYPEETALGKVLRAPVLSGQPVWKAGFQRQEAVQPISQAALKACFSAV